MGLFDSFKTKGKQKEVYSKEKAEKTIKELEESVKEMQDDMPRLKESFNYLKEYLDRLMYGEDDEITLEGFYKEKLDEVCVQISALQGNANTPEKEELKMLELKKTVLEDKIFELSNNEGKDKPEQKSSHSGIGSGATEMLVETSTAIDLIQGGIVGKK